MDTEALAACTAFYSSPDCADVESEGRAPCDAIFVGTRGIGEGCANYLECADWDSTTCVIAEGSDCGDCAALPGAGEPCTNACVDGFGCVFVTDAYVCTQLLDEGATCDPANDLCAAGLACDEGSTVCAAPVYELGGPCEFYCGYMTGLACVDAVCVARTVVDIGAECDEAAQYCRDQASTTTCIDEDGDGTGICSPRAVLGESCTNSDCAGETTCNDAGVCEALPTLGEACEFECEGAYYCDDGTCTDYGDIVPAVCPA